MIDSSKMLIVLYSWDRIVYAVDNDDKQSTQYNGF